MTAYYNEIDPYCAAWLRNLMHEGLIPHGHVDTRSIADVTPNDLAGYAQHHFFAGLGGWPAALRRAAWPDHRPVWTGSCPCQPFSLAGRQGGFADERHLWPFWRYLIAQRRPAVVLGEQVASATDWLRLVRGDLEVLDYAVGAIPVEAASAGADHLRDRYWFVAHHDSGGLRRSGICEEQSRRAEVIGDGKAGVSLADANHEGPQGRRVLSECAGQRATGPDGLADAYGIGTREQPEALSARQCKFGRDGAVPNAKGEQARSAGQPREHECLEWILGADGKARRVKPGIRLLAHGVPARVAKLRALGNAIDLRPATEFIKAVMNSI